MVDGTDAELTRWLHEYTSFGDHRTGTAPDRATTDWFADELAALGGRVDRHPFGFDRYVGDVTVSCGGTERVADLLFYEGVGRVRTDRTHVAAVEVMSGHETSAALRREIESARLAGAGAVVIATEHPLGELAMPNRRPELGSGLPAVLVAGRHRDALAADAVHVDLTAHIEAGHSSNVIARFGPLHDRPPIVLATPLTGWFTCAAERGTGIAALLGLVARLAGSHPVIVVGAAGHELLPHLGLDVLLGDPAITALAGDASLVVHLGANVAVAARDAAGEMALAPGHHLARQGAAARGVMVRLGDVDPDPVCEALAGAGLVPVLDPPSFLGEGALWSAAGTSPLMSFVGSSPWFHTPGDVPHNSTDASGLAVVTDAIAATVEAFLGRGSTEWIPS